MKKKLIASLVIGLTAIAGSCLAHVFDRVEQYKGNELKIPQVAGIHEQAAKKINSYIVRNIAADAKKFIDKHGAGGGTAWLYTTVMRDDEKYLSLRIASASYFQGAVHPNAFVFGLVFDKTTGKRLPLTYFVNIPSPSLLEENVRNNVFKFYSSGNIPLELEASSHITHISEQYTLDSNDNLDLYYQQYELGPYAIGSPYIRLDKLYVDRNGTVLPKG